MAEQPETTTTTEILTLQEMRIRLVRFCSLVNRKYITFNIYNNEGLKTAGKGFKEDEPQTPNNFVLDLLNSNLDYIYQGDQEANSNTAFFKVTDSNGHTSVFEVRRDLAGEVEYYKQKAKLEAYSIIAKSDGYHHDLRTPLTNINSSLYLANRLEQVDIQSLKTNYNNLERAITHITNMLSIYVSEKEIEENLAESVPYEFSLPENELGNFIYALKKANVLGEFDPDIYHNNAFLREFYEQSDQLALYLLELMDQPVIDTLPVNSSGQTADILEHPSYTQSLEKFETSMQSLIKDKGGIMTKHLRVIANMISTLKSHRQRISRLRELKKLPPQFNNPELVNADEFIARQLDESKLLQENNLQIEVVSDHGDKLIKIDPVLMKEALA